MLKKIAYVCRWPMEKHNGVTQKINDQISAWREMGIEVKLFCRSSSLPQDLPEKGLYSMPRSFSNFHLYRKYCADIEVFSPDVIYWRYEMPGPFAFMFARKFSGKTVIEINTNDIQEFRALCRTEPLRYMPRFLLNYLGRGVIFRNCGCIVSPMYELAGLKAFTKYSKRIIVAPNSINLCKHSILKHTPQAGEVKNILFLGSPKQPWHGTDKVAELAKALGNSVHIHVVGPSDSGLPVENITWHGYLTPDEYEPIAANCVTAIASMALFRNKMFEGSTLKVREYIAMGLPVIIPHPDSAFMENTPDWVCEIPNSDSSINNATTQKVNNFLDLMKDKVVSHAESAKFIDSAVLEKKRIEAINEWHILK